MARISSTGLDVAGMLAHARTVGGPALRELTFHQRAGLLKQLGLRLMAEKDAFPALSRRAGATDRDTAVDVDGGFGTLLSHASKGRVGLPGDAGPAFLLGPDATPDPRSSSCSSSSWSPR